MNEIYNESFLKAKQNYIKLGISNDELNTYLFNPTQSDITEEAHIDIQWCNDYIFNNFDFSNQVGLCSYLCTIGSYAYNLASQINISYITVGKVLHNEKNIFNVPKQDIVIKQFIAEQKTTQDIQVGGKLHVWITLENGLIIDPSINHTINNTIIALAEKPIDMQTKHNLVYKPYIVTGIDDLTKVHELVEPFMKKEAYKKQIDTQYSMFDFPGVSKK